MAGKQLQLIIGAIAGAVLVAALTLGLGSALREVAHPAVIVAIVAFGAILGAFAAGAIAYEREHEAPTPTAAYSEGALAEREPDAEADAPARDGLLWLARRRLGSLLKLPLNPWI
jgi:hypothetical protein